MRRAFIEWGRDRMTIVHTHRAHGETITALLRKNEVATSFWRDNDVIIMSYVHCVCGNTATNFNYIRKFWNHWNKQTNSLDTELVIKKSNIREFYAICHFTVLPPSTNQQSRRKITNPYRVGISQLWIQTQNRQWYRLEIVSRKVAAHIHV